MTRRIATVLALTVTLAAAPEYTSVGDLALPDYRKWVFLGSGFGMSYTEKAAENPPFTNVFAEPSAYDQYMKKGIWPDGTVLIAEMRASATNLSINKSGHAQIGSALAIEAEVKDKSKGGWRFYDFRNGSTSGKVLPQTAACYSCHVEHAAVDNTFVQFYPTLVDVAKQKGTYRADVR